MHGIAIIKSNPLKIITDRGGVDLYPPESDNGIPTIPGRYMMSSDSCNRIYSELIQCSAFFDTSLIERPDVVSALDIVDNHGVVDFDMPDIILEAFDTIYLYLGDF